MQPNRPSNLPNPYKKNSILRHSPHKSTQWDSWRSRNPDEYNMDILIRGIEYTEGATLTPTIKNPTKGDHPFHDPLFSAQIPAATVFTGPKVDTPQ